MIKDKYRATEQNAIKLVLDVTSNPPFKRSYAHVIYSCERIFDPSGLKTHLKMLRWCAVLLMVGVLVENGGGNFAVGPELPPNFEAVLVRYIDDDPYVTQVFSDVQEVYEGNMKKQWNALPRNKKYDILEISKSIVNVRRGQARSGGPKISDYVDSMPFIVKKVFANNCKNVDILLKLAEESRRLKVKVKLLKWLVFELRIARNCNNKPVIILDILERVTEMSNKPFKGTYFNASGKFAARIELLYVEQVLKAVLAEAIQSKDLSPMDKIQMLRKVITSKMPLHPTLVATVMVHMLDRVNIMTILPVLKELSITNIEQVARAHVALLKSFSDIASPNYAAFFMVSESLKVLQEKILWENVSLRTLKELEYLKAHLPSLIRTIAFARQVCLHHVDSGTLLGMDYRLRSLPPGEALKINPNWTKWVLLHFGSIVMIRSATETTTFLNANIDATDPRAHESYSMRVKFMGATMWEIVPDEKTVKIQVIDNRGVYYANVVHGLPVVTRRPSDWQIIDCSR